jgi:hypothetical protein
MIIEMQTKLRPCVENAPVRHALQNIISTLIPIRALIKQSGVSMGTVEAPFSSYLCSTPGMGKTYMADFAINDITIPCLNKVQLMDHMANPTRNIYNHPVGSNFHDTYNGNYTYYISDAFAAKDREGQESEVTLLINLIGNNDFTMNAAMLELKQKLHFTSKFMYICSNVLSIYEGLFKSVNDMDALIRRIDKNCWVLGIKPEFQLKTERQVPIQGHEHDPIFTSMLDYEKVNKYMRENKIDKFCSEPYLFYKYDIRNKKNLLVDGVAFSYDEYVKENIRLMKAHQAHEGNRLRHFSSYSKDLINKRLDELNAQSGFDDDSSIGSESYHSIPSQMFEDDPSDSIVGEYSSFVDSHSDHDRVKLIEGMANKYDDLLNFIREYLLECEKANCIVPPHCDGNLFHPYAILIDGVSLSDLKTLATDGFSGLAAYHYLGIKDKTKSFFSKTLESLIHAFNKARDGFKYLIKTPMAWLDNNPILKVCLQGAAVGWIFSIFALLLSSFVSTCASKAKDYFSGDSSIKDISVEKPDMETIVIESISQAGAYELRDTPFLEARLGNVWRSVTTRTWRDKDGSLKSTQRTLGCITMLGSLWGFMPWHFYKVMADFKKFPCVESVYLELSNFLQNGDQTDMKFRFEDLQFDTSQAEFDRVFIKFPPPMVYAPNLVKYLPSKKNKSFVEWVKSGKNIDIIFARKLGKTVTMQPAKLKFAGPVSYPTSNTMVDPLNGIIHRSENVHICHKDSYMIDVASTSGECGQWGVIVDKNRLQFAKDDPVMQHPVIFYHHHSGSDLSSLGFGSPLYKEDVAHLKFDTNISDHNTRIMEDLIFSQQIFSDVLPKSGEDGFEPHHRIIGEVAPLRVNMKSSIRRSELYGLFERTRMPARLSPYEKEGEKIFPMIKARSDYGSNGETVVNAKYADAIGNFVANKIISDSSRITNQDVLTFEQVIMGDLATNTAPVSRTTSCGFTLNYVKQQLGLSGKGKYWIFGDGEVIDMSNPNVGKLRHLLEHSLNRLKNGDRAMCVFTDCLKDELRPVDKGARLFCSGDFVYLLLCKMYFGAFAGWIYDNRIKNGICVGINPFSREWKARFLKLLSFSNNCIAGDFSKYDKKLLSSFMMHTLILINKYYGDSDLDSNNIRQLLFQDMIQSFHAAMHDGKTALYEWLHGNTSGNFLTAIINSIGNIGINVYAMVDIELSVDCNHSESKILLNEPNIALIEYIWNGVSFSIYGDDNQMSIRDRPNITFNSLQKSISFLGISYTDELKTKDGIIPDYRPVLDCSFIARMTEIFEYEGEVLFLAPLRLYSILESIMWYKKSIDSDELILKCDDGREDRGGHGNRLHDDRNYNCRRIFAYPRLQLPLSHHTILHQNGYHSRHDDRFNLRPGCRYLQHLGHKCPRSEMVHE